METRQRPWAAQAITEAVSIPTIGIGAGPHCDGQVLVTQDMLGMSPGFNPRFLKQYAQIGTTICDAVRVFTDEVRSQQFPTSEHEY